MDPITQASIGAAAAQSIGRTSLKTALLIGALGGFLPDSDVLIRSSEDPLLHLEYHRHFTHSLIFIPVGGLITAGIGQLLTRGRHRIAELWLPATLGWATHGLLDSCTSYGTYLLWPFSNARVAWHNVAIVDPLLTLPLLLGVLLAVWRRKRYLGRIALGWVLAYLTLGVVPRDRAAAAYAEHIDQRGHFASQLEVKPSIGNNILFRAFYLHEGIFYADSVRIPWWGESKIYEGGSIAALDVAQLRSMLDPVHQHDLDRFSYFSSGFLVEDPINPGYVSDFRYAMVPNEVAPMWGINIGERKAGKHMDFQRFSKPTKKQRELFVEQLWGR